MNIFLSSLGHDFDVLAFSETWYSDAANVVNLNGYKLETNSRRTKTGGGVALYMKESLLYEAVPEYTVMNSGIESLFIATNAHVLGVIYRPPSGPLELFYDAFNTIL